MHVDDFTNAFNATYESRMTITEAPPDANAAAGQRSFTVTRDRDGQVLGRFTTPADGTLNRRSLTEVYRTTGQANDFPPEYLAAMTVSEDQLRAAFDKASVGAVVETRQGGTSYDLVTGAGTSVNSFTIDDDNREDVDGNVASQNIWNVKATEAVEHGSETIPEDELQRVMDMLEKEMRLPVAWNRSVAANQMERVRGERAKHGDPERRVPYERIQGVLKALPGLSGGDAANPRVTVHEMVPTGQRALNAGLSRYFVVRDGGDEPRSIPVYEGKGSTKPFTTFQGVDDLLQVFASAHGQEAADDMKRGIFNFEGGDQSLERFEDERPSKGPRAGGHRGDDPDPKRGDGRKR